MGACQSFNTSSNTQKERRRCRGEKKQAPWTRLEKRQLARLVSSEALRAPLFCAHFSSFFSSGIHVASWGGLLPTPAAALAYSHLLQLPHAVQERWDLRQSNVVVR